MDENSLLVGNGFISSEDLQNSSSQNENEKSKLDEDYYNSTQELYSSQNACEQLLSIEKDLTSSGELQNPSENYHEQAAPDEQNLTSSDERHHSAQDIAVENNEQILLNSTGNYNKLFIFINYKNIILINLSFL